jgi:hypothetical protein
MPKVLFRHAFYGMAFAQPCVNTNPSKRLPTFDLTAGEVFALTLAKEMLAEYTGTLSSDSAQRAGEDSGTAAGTSAA